MAADFFLVAVFATGLVEDFFAVDFEAAALVVDLAADFVLADERFVVLVVALRRVVSLFPVAVAFFVLASAVFVAILQSLFYSRATVKCPLQPKGALPSRFLTSIR
ncbi:MAG: hypothetical protein AAFY84_06480 [Pseudomonadota bacterium]